MLIHQIPSGPCVTNAYIVAAAKSAEAAIIDPAPDSFDSIVKLIEKSDLKPVKIILTHSHWDHIADVKPLKDKYNIPVYIHFLDRDNLEVPGSDRLPCWIDIPSVTPDFIFNEKPLIIGNLEAFVINTPGHTPGGVCFYLPKEKLLFSGDTLFAGTIGNLSFPTARPALMWKSLAILAKLPIDTKVLPGHGPATTIGKEKWLDQAEELFG